jgi:hypothetical protein
VAAAEPVVLAVELGVLLLVGRWLGALGGARRVRRAAGRFARRAGLPAGSEPALAGRVVRRRRFVLAGIAVGLLAAGAVDQLWFAALYAGLAAGAVADRLTQPAMPPGTPRVAHATNTRVTDYVPRWLLGAVAVAAAAVPTLAVLWLVAPRTERNLGDPELSGGLVLALVLLTLAALLASRWLARVIVERRVAAGSAADLAIDDALRAQAVRDALHLSAATSVLAAYAVSAGLVEQDVDGVLRRVGGWFPLVLLAALAVVGTAHEVRGPRHWRSRLHPELDGAAVDA